MSHRNELVIRDFQEMDAVGISALFLTVYGEHYVYPDVYLPSMILRHNLQGHWRSAVACVGDRIVGHSILWMDALQPGSAELALNVVDPSARGLGIATRLGAHLCALARKLGLHMLTIKQVSTHSQSQRLARTLGFHTTGLLLDYVASPFGPTGRESIVLGCLPLQPRPLPDASLPQDYDAWFSPLSDIFGSGAAPDLHPTPAPMALDSQGKRLEVTFDRIESSGLDEVERLPRNRLVYVRLPLDRSLPSCLPRLKRAGYASAGLMPAPHGRWYWLMQRGFETRNLSLQCALAQKLYDDTQRTVAAM